MFLGIRAKYSFCNSLGVATYMLNNFEVLSGLKMFDGLKILDGFELLDGLELLILRCLS